MDALDELNGHIEALCAIAERERARILDEIMTQAYWLGEECGDPTTGRVPTPAEIGGLALDYAQWTHTLEGYRALLRRAEWPVVVEK